MTGTGLKKLRKTLGLNQAKFADTLAISGIGQPQISKMEAGKMEIPASITIAIEERGWEIEAEPTGPEWMIRHDEQNFKRVVHLHQPRFTAQILASPAPGCLTAPETGITVGNFNWVDAEPGPVEIAELAAAACEVWAAYIGANDGDID